MKQIIEWLIFIEDWANQIYDELASKFSDDDEYFDFINRISNDESLHSHYMQIALQCLEQHPSSVAEVMLDRQTMNHIEIPLKTALSFKKYNSIKFRVSTIAKINKKTFSAFIKFSHLPKGNLCLLYNLRSLKEIILFLMGN